MPGPSSSFQGQQRALQDAADQKGPAGAVSTVQQQQQQQHVLSRTPGVAEAQAVAAGAAVAQPAGGAAMAVAGVKAGSASGPGVAQPAAAQSALGMLFSAMADEDDSDDE